MSPPAIVTHGLSKRYTLGTGHGYDSLRDSIVKTARRSVGRVSRGGEPSPELRELWALRDLSLSIEHGEVVGLIGHNGAGKSTLLKILSRITEPTEGSADVTGRVGSLLEVGTGFHPELTGRENVFLNGAILGMRRQEVRRRFDEIVAFAEMERFLDTPVKRYSSGMTVRLAFAVAAHLDTEILIVDEVLSVGDAAFQRKSLGKMNAVASEGRTVIFVSHNLAIIRALCQRGVVLEGGRAVADGAVADTIDHYLRTLERASSDDLLQRADRDRRGYRDTRIRGVEVRDAAGRSTQAVVGGQPVSIRVQLTDVVPMLQCQLTIVNSLGQPITTLDSEVVAPGDIRDAAIGPMAECDISALPLMPGRYRVDVLIRGRRQIQDGLQAALFFDVEPGVIGERAVSVSGVEGDVALDHVWRLPS
jgi:lipopolysaccharide transport system ATP-binding protein